MEVRSLVPEEIGTLMGREGAPFEAPAGAVLFHPGDVCPGYILLRSGSIRVALLGASGREATLYRVGPGEICVQTFQCLVTHDTYTAFGEAETPLEGVILGQDAFERQMGESPAFRRFVLIQVAKRFESLTRAVELTAFTPIAPRLAGALLARATHDEVALTHADLAADIGTAREVVSRHLKRFADEGLVALERHRIRLLATDRLRRLESSDG